MKNSNLIDLKKIGLAKQVIHELPPIIEKIDRLIIDLEPYTYYHPVDMMLMNIVNYQILLKSQLENQKKIYEKGVITSEEK